jgi:hypothetical protein
MSGSCAICGAFNFCACGRSSKSGERLRIRREKGLFVVFDTNKFGKEDLRTFISLEQAKEFVSDMLRYGRDYDYDVDPPAKPSKPKVTKIDRIRQTLEVIIKCPLPNVIAEWTTIKDDSAFAEAIFEESADNVSLELLTAARNRVRKALQED